MDQIDHNLLLLLSERQAVVRQIGEVKKKRGRKIGDKKREREILRKQLSVARDLGLDEAFVTELLHAVFHLAKTTQKQARRGKTR